MLKTRSHELEIMDHPDQPPEITRAFHRDLKRIHGLMGNWRLLAVRLKQGERPESLMDIGCGDGALLAYLRRELNLREVMGVDLKPPSCAIAGVKVIAADATRDPLPHADAAVCVMMLHHLTDQQVTALLQNVGLSVKRFLCVDPVRHWMPLVLYTLFLCPFLSKVGAADGKQSIRRSFQAEELRTLAVSALAGRPVEISVTTTPFWTKLIVDIRFLN